MCPRDPYYRPDLALVHHLGFATFLRNDDGSWRRDDERHENVLLDTSVLPELLAGSGVDVTLRTSFGTEALPAGLRVLVGQRPLNP